MLIHTHSPVGLSEGGVAFGFVSLKGVGIDCVPFSPMEGGIGPLSISQSGFYIYIHSQTMRD